MNFIPLGSSDTPECEPCNNSVQSGRRRPHDVKNSKNDFMKNQSRKRTLTAPYEEASTTYHAGAKKKKTFSGPAIIRLHNEIKAFYEDVRPTEAERQTRQRVVAMVTDTIKSLWSGARVELFGSFVTGLYLPTSDIDMVVFGGWSHKPLHTLKQELVKRKICLENDTQVLDKATVPILKIKETSTRIKVDISFNMTNGLSTAKMIKSYVEEFPPLKYLVMVLKQFLYWRDLNEVYTGGLSSYSVILLIVSFLQLHARKEGRSTDVNLGVLLLEFLELYGINFNYSRLGISLKKGGEYVRKSDASLNDNVSLYIEDPDVPDNDVARGTYNMHVIQKAFSHCYHILSQRLIDDDRITQNQSTDRWSNQGSQGSRKRKAEGEQSYDSLLDVITPPPSKQKKFNRTF